MIVVIVGIGPLLCAAAALLGRALGGSVGFTVAMISIGALAIATWFVVGKLRSGAAGFAAAAVWMFAGGVNAHVGHSLALRSSGDHAFGMHVADIAAWRDRERVTFADGGERWRLEGRAGHLVPNPRDRTRTSYDCTATPIAPDAWTHDQPVKLWAVDDGVPRSRPWSEQVFHPTTTLSDDCAAAVHEAIDKHHLVAAPDALYLERLDMDADPTNWHRSGLAAAIVPAAGWLVGWLWLGLRELLARRRRRRGR